MMTGLIKNELIKLSHNRKVYAFMVALLIINIIPVLMTLVVRIRTLDGQSYPSTLFGFTVSWVIPLFLIAIIAEMITEEYTAGTLSLSLVHPVSRLQLFTGKAVTLLLLILVALIYALLLGYGIGTVFFGCGNEFFMRGIAYSSWEGVQFTVGTYLLAAIPLWSFSLLVMFLAMVMSSGASVVGIAAGILLVFTMLDLLAAEISPYLITTYFSSLPALIMLTPGRPNLLFALLFVLLHSVLFYLAGFIVLQKRDMIH
jgi:ABC-2 type transport system permease protein